MSDTAPLRRHCTANLLGDSSKELDSESVGDHNQASAEEAGSLRETNGIHDVDVDMEEGSFNTSNGLHRARVLQNESSCHVSFSVSLKVFEYCSSFD